MDIILGILILGITITIPIIWLYGVYKIYKDKSSLYGLIFFLFCLLAWRMYDNYSVGGMLIPLGIEDAKAWILNDIHWIELVLWFFLFAGPFAHAFAESCKKCGSTELKQIDKELVSKDTISKMVDVAVGTKTDGTTIYQKQKEYYNVLIYTITMECKECGYRWKKQKKVEELI